MKFEPVQENEKDCKEWKHYSRNEDLLDEARLPIFHGIWTFLHLSKIKKGIIRSLKYFPVIQA